MDIPGESLLNLIPPPPTTPVKRIRNSLDKSSPKEPLSCDECSKTFKFKSLLVAHKKAAHTVPKPFKCKTCPKTFKKESYLQIHERIHDDKTSVSCNICFQKFPYISKLRIHQQTHLRGQSSIDFAPKFWPHSNNLFQDFSSNCNLSAPLMLPQHVEMNTRTDGIVAIPDTASQEKFVPHCVPQLVPQTVDTYLPENVSCLKVPDVSVPQYTQTEKVGERAYNMESSAQSSNSTKTKSKAKVPKPFKCTQCPKAFKKEAYLQIHLRIHDERTVCICNICFKPFPRKGNLRAHQRLTHFREKPGMRMPKGSLMPLNGIGDQSQNSQVNASPAESRTNNFGEQVINASVPQFASPGATSKFGSPDAPPKFGSPDATDKFPSPNPSSVVKKKRKKKMCSINPQSMCSVQVTTQDGVETKICDICHKPYIESSNGVQQCSAIICYLCDALFPSMGDLDKHIMDHKTQKNYPCHLCEKRFLQNAELKEHFSKHTADGYYFCHFCDQSFSQQKSLDSHVVQHIVEQNFFCQFCNKCFLLQSDLDAHLTDHIVSENYPCETCGLLLLSSADLEEHLTVHQGKNDDCRQNPSS